VESSSEVEEDEEVKDEEPRCKGPGESNWGEGEEVAGVAGGRDDFEAFLRRKRGGRGGTARMDEFEAAAKGGSHDSDDTDEEEDFSESVEDAQAQASKKKKKQSKAKKLKQKQAKKAKEKKNKKVKSKSKRRKRDSSSSSSSSS